MQIKIKNKDLVNLAKKIWTEASGGNTPRPADNYVPIGMLQDSEKGRAMDRALAEKYQKQSEQSDASSLRAHSELTRLCGILRLLVLHAFDGDNTTQHNLLMVQQTLTDAGFIPDAVLESVQPLSEEAQHINVAEQQIKLNAVEQVLCMQLFDEKPHGDQYYCLKPEGHHGAHER